MPYNHVRWNRGSIRVRGLFSYQALVGNGPNRALQKNSASWKDLLKGIANRLNIKWASGDENLPFPLLYEYFLEKGDVRESELKNLVAQGIADLEPGPLVPFFQAIGCQNILTTNYDAATALAATRGNEFQNSSPIQETVYSLFRYMESESARCWQIHGAENEQGSVVLGYDSYSKYISKIKEYLDDGVSYKNGEYKLPSLKDRLKHETSEPRELEHLYSWIDFFFLPRGFRLYILGLSMDFVEMHLWWLLTHRSRMQKNGYGPFGDIIYLYPSFEEEKIQPKSRLLEAKSVQTIPVTMKNNWKEYYLDAARKIG